MTTQHILNNLGAAVVVALGVTCETRHQGQESNNISQVPALPADKVKTQTPMDHGLSERFPLASFSLLPPAIQAGAMASIMDRSEQDSWIIGDYQDRMPNNAPMCLGARELASEYLAIQQSVAALIRDFDSALCHLCETHPKPSKEELRHALEYIITDINNELNSSGVNQSWQQAVNNALDRANVYELRILVYERVRECFPWAEGTGNSEIINQLATQAANTITKLEHGLILCDQQKLNIESLNLPASQLITALSKIFPGLYEGESRARFFSPNLQERRAAIAEARRLLEVRFYSRLP